MPKSNGEPRTVVDYSGIHDACSRQTHQRDDSANVIDVLGEYTARWSIPEVFSSDGASVFTSQLMENFKRWGIKHRVSSPYYARAN